MFPQWQLPHLSLTNSAISRASSHRSSVPSSQPLSTLPSPSSTQASMLLISCEPKRPVWPCSLRPVKVVAMRQKRMWPLPVVARNPCSSSLNNTLYTSCKRRTHYTLYECQTSQSPPETSVLGGGSRQAQGDIKLLSKAHMRSISVSLNFPRPCFLSQFHCWSFKVDGWQLPFFTLLSKKINNNNKASDNITSLWLVFGDWAVCVLECTSDPLLARPRHTPVNPPALNICQSTLVTHLSTRPR